MRLSLIILITFCWLRLSFTQQSIAKEVTSVNASQKDSARLPIQDFYSYQNAGKLIDQIATLMVQDSISFNYGIQTNRNYEVVGSTSFYHRSTDVLHIILMTKTQRRFHFEITVLGLRASSLKQQDGKNYLVLQSDDQLPIFIKEYNAQGGLVFSLGSQEVEIPLSRREQTSRLPKLFQKLLKRISKFIC